MPNIDRLGGCCSFVPLLEKKKWKSPTEEGEKRKEKSTSIGIASGSIGRKEKKKKKKGVVKEIDRPAAEITEKCLDVPPARDKEKKKGQDASVSESAKGTRVEKPPLSRSIWEGEGGGIGLTYRKGKGTGNPLQVKRKRKRKEKEQC